MFVKTISMFQSDEGEAISEARVPTTLSAFSSETFGNGAPLQKMEVTPENIEQSLERNSEVAAVVYNLSKEMVEKKKFNGHDLFNCLNKCKNDVKKFEIDQISQSADLNLLMACVEKGRVSLLSVFTYLGWWKTLSEETVPISSSSEHVGKNAKELAKSKRSTRLLQEVQRLETLEASLTPLMKAARSGKIQEFDQCLRQSAATDYHLADSDRNTLLHWAIIGQNPDIFKRTLSLGVDPTTPNIRKETILHQAAYLGLSNMVQGIVQAWNRTGRDLTLEVDISNRSTLDRVAENGDIEFLRALRRCGVQVTSLSSMLATAAFHERKPFVEHCIKDLKISVNSSDRYQRTGLMRAIEVSNLDIIR